MNKGDRMSKEKRNIATKLETESKYLTRNYKEILKKKKIH
jgi:hypothetical protein